MERNVTFIHAADLHLDSPFKGLSDMPAHLFEEIKESTFQALNRLVEAAIAYEVDFVLITGDLFDNERQSLKAQVRLRKAFERLEEQRIQVFVSYGNHDFINGNTHQVTYPDNVHIFPDEQVRSFVYEKAGHRLARVYGFSYVDRAVTDNKTSDYIIKDKDIPFHIAMLHGSVQGDEEHARYAPFQLSDLVMKDFQYWALGHIHKRTVLKTDPYIVYPGNIQGRHRKETGEKGCYVVQLTDREADLTFVPLQSIAFNDLSIDASSSEDVFQLEDKLMETIGNLSVKHPQLLDVSFITNNSKLRRWQRDGHLDDMVDLVNENLSVQIPWKFIFRTVIRTEPSVFNVQDTKSGEYFYSELKQRFAESQALEHVEELYQHRQARKYLERPSQADAEAWKQEAKARLQESLRKGEAK